MLGRQIKLHSYYIYSLQQAFSQIYHNMLYNSGLALSHVICMHSIYVQLQRIVSVIVFCVICGFANSAKGLDRQQINSLQCCFFSLCASLHMQWYMIEFVSSSYTMKHKCYYIASQLKLPPNTVQHAIPFQVD